MCIRDRFNFINNGLQRFNRAFGDASGMTVILDEPRLVDDKPGAPELEVREGAIDFEGIDFWYTDEMCIRDRCTAQPARMWAGCIPPTARQRKLDARFW